MIHNTPSTIKTALQKNPQLFLGEFSSQINRLIKDTPTKKDHVSSIELEKATQAVAKKNKIAIRKIHLSENWWKEDHGYIIGFLKSSLKPIGLIYKNDSYHQIENNVITPISDSSELKHNILNIGFHIFKQLPNKNKSFLSIARFFFKEELKKVTTLLCLGILSVSIWYFLPFFFHHSLHTILLTQPQNIIRDSLFFSVLCISLWSMRVLFTFKANTLLDTIFTTIQTIIWSNVLDQQHTASKSQEFNPHLFQLSTIKESLSLNQISGVIIHTLKLPIVCIAFLFNPITGIALIASTSLTLLFHCVFTQYFYKKSMNNNSQSSNECSSQLTLNQIELMTTPTENLGKPLLQQTLKKMKTKISNLIKEEIHSYSLKTYINTLLIVLIPISWISSLFYQFLQSNQPSIPVILTTLLIVLIVSHSLNEIVKTTHTLLEKTTPLFKVNALNNQNTPLKFEALNSALTLDKLSFHYPDTSTLLLKDICLELPIGSLNIITPSANAGSTTLLKLLSNELSPSKGSITINSLLTKPNSSITYQEKVNPMLILQEHCLIEGTLLENLIGKTSTDISEVWKVLTQLNLEKNIRHLPLGLLTPIHHINTLFSHSIEKRLLLAYGLLHESPILLIDNIFTQISKENHHFINQALINSGKTVLIVSNNTDLEKNATNIFEIKNKTLQELVTTIEA